MYVLRIFGVCVFRRAGFASEAEPNTSAKNPVLNRVKAESKMTAWKRHMLSDDTSLCPLVSRQDSAVTSALPTHREAPVQEERYLKDPAQA